MILDTHIQPFNHSIQPLEHSHSSVTVRFFTTWYLLFVILIIIVIFIVDVFFIFNHFLISWPCVSSSSSTNVCTFCLSAFFFTIFFTIFWKYDIFIQLDFSLVAIFDNLYSAVTDNTTFKTFLVLFLSIKQSVPKTCRWLIFTASFLFHSSVRLFSLTEIGSVWCSI